MGLCHKDGLKMYDVRSKMDAIVKAIEGVLAGLHPVTNAIFTGVMTYRNEIEMRFVKDVIVGVNERVFKLEERLDKEYIKSEDYKNFLYKTLRIASYDVRKEKLKLFANIIVNSALIENADEHDDRKYLFDETIDKIDEKLFNFILRMKQRSLTSGDKDVEGWKGTDDDLAILGVDDRTFSFYADYLLGVGVVVRIPRFHMGDNDGGLYYTNEYYVTQYGLEFVEYVKDQA